MKNIYLPGMMEMFATKSMCDIKVDQCIERWEQSKKLPRKAKKEARKDILVDYSIFSYGGNLFNF